MENRNISVAKINGYTLEKVKRAKKYLDEIGNNKRNFDFARLVTMYNDILGMNDSTSGCRCQSPKYYNGIQNYYKYGKLTLINNGLAKETDFIEKEETPIIENEAKRIILDASEAVSDAEVKDGKEDENKGLSEEDLKKEQMKERMAKVRAARKNKVEEVK